ncbi:glycosyl transferase family 2 [Shewanella baltica OS625]|uniref:Glycosyltransferase 2-like domain-containing protein n=1 Tax=Shewanella baltica (strain OS195) TaxID=399599 RepID=A9KVT7_SHEB9|nr:glycosyltransferase [Shewanella baltica]ABX50186.1 hypothetical protein Sbal195_3021 [Shewanella baltica OS195]ADT95179.1 glycosyl transferase family 2 [Shewanella baltica OS678]EHC06308.1 glycosyl transferase family 2 [Shewanella baltica OS625]
MLTIAISTFNKRIDFLNDYCFDDRVFYLINWQSPINYNFKLPDNVKLIQLNTVGVACSRNAAIDFCQTPWIWFMDDDVVIPNDSISQVLGLIHSANQNNVFISGVKSPEGLDIKSYNLSCSDNVRSILSVGTIQIIANATAIKNAKVQFPTNMGAGTENNLCDEPVFLHRLSKTIKNLKFVFPSGLYVIHPLERSGSVYSTKGSVRSRAMLFREIYGLPLCVFASIYFLCRHRKQIGKFWIYLFSFKRAS